MTADPRPGQPARPDTPPDPGNPDGGQARRVGYVELYGRLLAAANGQPPATASPAPNGRPPAGRSPSLHRHVLTGLGHHVPPVPADRTTAGRLVYLDAGVPLTAKAAYLADLVQVAEVDFAATWTEAVTGLAPAVATTPGVDEDRRVGNGAVLASLHHLVRAHGAPATTPGVRVTLIPLLFGPGGEPASLFGRILPTWGLAAADAAGREPVWAVNLLAAAGWQVSDRARAAIIAAQDAESAGRSWGQALSRAAAATLRTSGRQEWDR
jgi:hypothetical protein